MEEKERLARIKQIKEENIRLEQQRQQALQTARQCEQALIANAGRLDELENQKWKQVSENEPRSDKGKAKG